MGEASKNCTSTATLREDVERITQVKGIGTITAAGIFGYLPEIGTLSDKEGAALTGVAPYNDDSGTHRGKRTIQEGRPHLRRLLYMAAISAANSNDILCFFYRRLREAGKPHKVAILAVMRKLIVLANRIVADPEFQPS